MADKIKLPEESRIAGVFGESATAFHLIKKGIHVMNVDTVFFDVMVKDPARKMFNTKNIVGISVKIRDRSSTTPSCTVQIKEFPKIQLFSDKWNVDPWFCFIIIFKEKGKKILEGFLFSSEDAKKYMAEGKREYAISFSKLRKARDCKELSGNNCFTWRLE